MIKASNIKVFRIKLKLRSNEMADLLGISRPLFSMIEGSHRRVPGEVDKRMAWSQKLLAEAEKSFELVVNKLTLSNSISARFAEKELRTKRKDLVTAEMQHAILLRDNKEFSRIVYLLKMLKPTPGLKPSELAVFEAWQNYMVRKAEVRLEKAGPEVILKAEMKIASMRAEIQCLENHLGINTEPA